jgi:hypothetical protein
LRHPQPLVEPLVLGFLEVVAARLLQLLVDKADPAAGRKLMVEELLRLLGCCVVSGNFVLLLRFGRDLSGTGVVGRWSVC